MVAASKRDRSGRTRKVVDEAAVIRCAVGIGVLREERWENEQGELVRYNLAFINQALFQRDNGRVLGYDTAHGGLHRHFAGKVEPVDLASFEAVYRRFLTEVSALRRLREL
jgi:Ser/Thr protein kinase RdoA (MazF antagonist)